MQRAFPDFVHRYRLAVVLLLPFTAEAADVTLSAPDTAAVGAAVEVQLSGEMAARDFVTIVPVGTAAGRYEAYQYAGKASVTLIAPERPGDYEIRYLAADAPYATLASRPLTIEDVQATLVAPDSVSAGADFAIRWTGPDNPRDFITLVPAGTPDGKYAVYAYTSKGSPVTLRAPDVAGEYELRYLLGTGAYRTLGTRPVAVSGSAASLSAPATTAAGSPIEISWQGPDNTQDFITIVPAGTADKKYDAYVYTARGNPARMTAPEDAGNYEIRYLTGQTYATLATVPLAVKPVSATLLAPDSAPARNAVSVTWEGPGNPTDYVVLLPVGSDNAVNGNYAYVNRGKTLRIATPEAAGNYELRYVTALKRLTLGMRPITILPSAVPGALRVVDERMTGTDISGTTVAVVLDASGSMLQRIGGKRRIDLAKAAVTGLVKDTLPDTVAFTLRVFGHKEADSCRSDLEIPAGPLDRARATTTVASIEAMNLARTPIAESLRLTLADTGGKPGPLLVILVTDGEETCDGNPAAVIREMAARGTDVRVNIVGFAIDELMLQETFTEWARLGNGRYFNAADGEELSASLRQSVEVPYSVLDANGTIVTSGTVNGPPVAVDAGTYQVVVPSDPGRTLNDVIVRTDETTQVDFAEGSQGEAL